MLTIVDAFTMRTDDVHLSPGAGTERLQKRE